MNADPTARDDSSEDETLKLAGGPTRPVSGVAWPGSAFPAMERPGDLIGHYKLLEELGKGGFGVVWRAEQTEPIHREVALKVIKPGMDSREIIARFESERQALAMMDHPNIAAVLDAGTTQNGRPFFAMELVKGTPITEYCNEHQLSVSQRLELFIPVCQAVQHAHQKAILHRDLKPANILVTETDGKPMPKVIDFGIAKALYATDEPALHATLARTMEGMFVGTPQYMSPEQAGSVPDVDTRSDIYTLGVILYELLVGDTPIGRDQLKKAAMDEVLRVIREREPRRPSSRFIPATELAKTTATQRHTEPKKLSHALRGDLDWIMLKALEKDRARRYDTANDFAMDLRRHLDDEPVSAGPPSAAYRLRKLVRRNRLAFGAAAAILVMLSAGITVTTWQWREASRQRAEALKQGVIATRERGEAVKQKELADERRRVAELGVAKGLTHLAESGQTWDEMKKLSLESRRAFLALGYPTAYADRVLAYAWETAPPAVDILSAGTAGLRCLAIRPHTLTAVSGGDDGAVRLWNLFPGHQAQVLIGHQGIVRAVAYSPDGSRLVSAGDDGTIRLWDAERGKSLRVMDAHHGPVYSVVFLQDGRSVLTAGEKGNVRMWNTDDGTETRSFPGHTELVRSVAISPDGKLAASGGDDKTVKLWDLATGSLLHDWKDQHPIIGPTRTVVFYPKGDRIAVSGLNNMHTILEIASGNTTVGSSPSHPSGVTSMAFSSSKKLLATAGDLTIDVSNYENADTTTTEPYLTGHTDDVTAAVFLEDGHFIISSSLDGTLRLWRSGLAFGHLLGTASYPRGVRSVDISRDSRMTVVVGYALPLTIWDLATGQLLRTFPDKWDWVGARFLSDGRQLVAAGHVGGVPQLIFNDMITGTEAIIKSGHSANLSGLAISPDGRLAATASEDKTVKLWDTLSHTSTLTLLGHQGAVRAVAFSPNGRLLLSASDDQTARIWDPLSGRELRQLTGHAGPVLCAAFSPDGNQAVTGGKDRLIKVWDVPTGREIRTITGSTYWVSCVTYSADGKLIVSGAAFYPNLRMWDAETGRKLHSIDTDQWPTNVAASSDGNWVVAGFEHNGPQAWDVGRPSRLFPIEARLQEARREIASNPEDAKALTTYGEWYAVCDEDSWVIKMLTKAQRAGAKVPSLLMARSSWKSNGALADRVASLKDAERYYQQAIEQKEAPEFYLKLCLEAVRVQLKESSQRASLAGQAPTAFRYQYNSENMQWTRRGQVWEEKPPKGAVKILDVVRQDRVDGRTGSVVTLRGDKGFKIFVSNLDELDPQIYFWLNDKQQWNLLGKMNDVRPSAEDRERALALIAQLGGKIERDLHVTGEPIVALDLENTKTDDARLQQIKDLTSVRSINLHGCVEVGDAGLEALGQMENLESIQLFGCGHISDNGFQYLGGLAKLTTLHIGYTGTDRITGSGLVHIKDLTGLKALGLGHLRVLEGRSLQHIMGLKNLEELYLGNCWELGDDSLEYITELSQLQFLELNDTQVTDLGLGKLRKLTHLKKLVLTRKLTDAEIADFEKNMAGWGKSGWKKPLFTEAGVAALKEAMPGLTIVRP